MDRFRNAAMEEGVNYGEASRTADQARAWGRLLGDQVIASLHTHLCDLAAATGALHSPFPSFRGVVLVR